jgi:hypothetical protein
MKNELFTLIKIFKSIQNSIIINLTKKRNLKLLIEVNLIFFLINIFIFVPSFIVSNFIKVLNFFILTNLVIFLIYLINILIKRRNPEKINKEFYEYSIIKSDFFHSLKNDIFVNIKTSIISVAFISAYVFLIYFLLFILKIITIKYFVLFTIIFFIFFLLLIPFSLFIYFISKRDLKSTFFKIQNYKIFTKKSLFKKLKINWIRKNSEKTKKENETEKFGINLGFIINIVFLVFLFFLLLLALMIFNGFLKLSFKIILFQSFVFPMFFTYHIFRKHNTYLKNKNRSFIFTVFIFSIIFILNFFQPVKLDNIFKEDSIFKALRDFIFPIINSYNNLTVSKNNFFNEIFILFYLLIPGFFLLIYYCNNKLLQFKNYIEKLLDQRIIKNLNESHSPLIFGDTISKYPFIFSLTLNILLIILILLEKKSFSGFFYGIVNTLQISNVFHLQFLTKENIFSFFDIIFNILILSILLKLVLLLISSFFSHLMLFNDEIVYIENKTIFSTILRIPISNVNYIIIKQNIIEKILDIGTIFIETSDQNGIIKIKGISSIKEKNKIIMEKVKIGLQKTK